MKILITGVAGFIGSNLAIRLLNEFPGIKVLGIDSLNHYYDVALKEWRLEEIKKAAESSELSEWIFIKGSIADKELLNDIFEKFRPEIVVNLAAQAGVRYSIENPEAYIEANIVGFFNILECCRHSYDDGKTGIKHLVFASSSSVYGNNEKVPYSTDDRVDNPVSLYAATKKSDELLAYAYSELYGIPCTGLRFFTVYGPGGRPDMAYFKFTDKLIKGETIDIYNYGNCQRDFTFIDDIVEGISRVIQKPPKNKKNQDGKRIPPYEIYNIGNGKPVNLLEFVDTLQKELVDAGVLQDDFDFEAHRRLIPMQPGDVAVTYSDTTALERDFGFRPHTTLKDGLKAFAQWYKGFYNQSAKEI